MDLITQIQQKHLRYKEDPWWGLRELMGERNRPLPKTRLTETPLIISGCALPANPGSGHLGGGGEGSPWSLISLGKKASSWLPPTSICVSFGPVGGICARPEGWRGRGGSRRTRELGCSVCICWLQGACACTNMFAAMEGSQNLPWALLMDKPEGFPSPAPSQSP